MPITYRFDEGLNCVLLRCVGDISRKDVIATAEQAFGDERIRPNHLRLHDMRALTGPRTAPELAQFAQLVMQHDTEKPPRRAAVVVGTDIDFGMLRVFIGNLGEAGDSWQVFRDMDEAMRWLGLPEDAKDAFETGEWTEVSS